MKIRAAVSLVSAVATLALVLSLIACGETKGDGETASVVYPDVPNIPIATSSVTEAPAPSTNKPDSTQTTRDPATASPTSAETATATEPVDVLTEPQRMLIAAAVRTANTDGAHVTVVCVNRLTDGAGQSTEVKNSVEWRRVGGNCTQSGTGGYTLQGGTFYLTDAGVKVPALTAPQVAWIYESVIAPGLLPFDPVAVQTLNASGKSVTVSGVRDQYRDALLESLQTLADNVTLTEVTGAAALNANGSLADSSFRVSMTYTVEGDTYRQDVEIICSYSYGDTEAIGVPTGADTCRAVSFRDLFDVDVPAETETGTATETAQEPQQTVVRYVTATALNVRSSPDFSSASNIVGYLKKGDRVVILEDYGNYVVIEYNGKRCYIGTRYLSETKPD